MLSDSKLTVAGGIGCYIKCVAILEGNTSSTNDDKVVWAVTGQLTSAASYASGLALFQ